MIRFVRERARDSDNVAFGDHARERMDLRDISDAEAIRVLRTGEIKGDMEAGSSPGEWKCKVVAPIRGSREVGVVTIVVRTGCLFVKTVEWEDR